MFYSQFILAKKGPLGTIWIAAHLERKLRKNQVADTDIGVSVDSILFPEVPIALRLSSHLLLGVVRIYSRKVNYLFHDCSEALLKVKQAFRSTAVDLPPEESTAPYHSITLPETFDLDDFELPDNEFFQGNYVDHHVSTREQITLQDTMEGVVYSTSQFGLDERFGDGDASQIGLDLDEDLFLDKVAAPGHSVVLLDLEEDADPQASGQPMTPLTNMDIDEDQNNEEISVKTSEVMPADGSGDQIEGTSANPITDLIECVQAPSTPGLAGEANPAIVQELPALNRAKITLLPESVEVMMPDVTCNLESEDHNSTELVAKENLGNHSSKPDLHYGDTNAVDCSLLGDKSSDTVLHMPTGGNASLSDGLQIKHVKQQGESPSTAETAYPMSADTARSVSSPTSVLAEQLKPISPVSECSDRIIAASDGQEKAEIISNKESSLSSIDQTHAEYVQPQGIPSHITAASPGTSCHVPTLEEPCSKPLSTIESISKSSSDSQPISGDMPESDHFPHKETSDPEGFRDVVIVGDMDKSCSPSTALLPSNTDCLLGSADGLELENVEDKVCLLPQDSTILNHGGSDKMPCAHSHVLQACNSCMNQPDVLSLVDGNLVEVVPDLPSGGVGLCSLETSGMREAFHASGASPKVQAEGCDTTDVTDTVLEANQILEAFPCEDIQTDFSKSDECLDNVILGDTQLDTLNCSASSDLPAPEKLLSAPEGVSNLPNDLLVEPTPDKEVLAEHEGNGDGFKILSGKKRHLMEDTPVLQSGNSAKLSGVLQSKRTVDSIPDDDDLLSSILVGRRTSVLKMRPTPPPPEVASSKRPRLASRVSVAKRKVLLDDTMVLHGDTIRQQLTSTEDIRRMRKKAPCTRTEIWMIQKHVLEDEIFSEPIFTGSSTFLICLHNQTYDLSEARISQNDANHTSLEVVKDMKLSVSEDVSKETNVEGCAELIVISNAAEAQPGETRVQTANQQGEEHAIGSLECDAQVQTEVLTDIHPLGLSKDGILGEIAEMEIDRGDVGTDDVENHALTVGAEFPSPTGPLSGDNCNLSAGPIIDSSPMHKSNGIEVTLQNDAPCLSPDQELDIQSVEKDSFTADIRVGTGVDAIEVAEVNEENMNLPGSTSGARDKSALEVTEGGGSVDVVPPSFHQQFQVDLGENSSLPVTVPMLDKCSVEISADVLKQSFAPTEDANTFLPDVSPGTGVQTNLVVVTGDQAMEGIRKNELGVVNENEVLARIVGYDEENPSSKPIFSEEPQRDYSLPLELNVDMRDVPLNEGENPNYQEADPLRTMDAESTALDSAAVRDPDDFGNVIVGNDTEFLNVDDDDYVAEEEDNSMPSAEEAHFLENSGWSSRTRAVAKYLQTLFDKEAGHGRKVLPVDNILAGKTRKEASRMFFETLVLKTRDYIHVEQENPFHNINIKPRVKLMKSDF